MPKRPEENNTNKKINNTSCTAKIFEIIGNKVKHLSNKVTA